MLFEEYKDSDGIGGQSIVLIACVSITILINALFLQMC